MTRRGAILTSFVVPLLGSTGFRLAGFTKENGPWHDTWKFMSAGPWLVEREGRIYHETFVYREDKGKPWQSFNMDVVYTPSMKYIGTVEDAKTVLVKWGLRTLRPARPDGKVCNIGFSPNEGCWYGWSHRAIFGFGGGDMIFDEHFPGATNNTPFGQHGSVPIRSFEDAMESARNFARWVS